MCPENLQTPVAIFIFNRPETTQKVLNSIKLAKPSKLFVFADGPRHDRLNEAEKCEATRSLIDQVDWDCKVFRDFSNTNQGCANRVASGLNLVFSLEEEAIILEDDCIPHPTFFRYSSELLEYYRHDERIMSVCGLSVPQSIMRDSYSYCFTQYIRCWGWATWRRAWQHYDHDMKLWPQVKKGKLLNNFLQNKSYIDFWTKIFQEVFDGKIDSWAYRWMFSCWLQSGMHILPEVNLISNVGFGADATHTANDSFAANLTTQEIQFPLRHSPYVFRDTKVDHYIQKTRHTRDLVYRIGDKIKRTLGT